MPMIAIMAKRPLASSACNFLVFSAGSEEVSTVKPSWPGLPSTMSLPRPPAISVKPA